MPQITPAMRCPSTLPKRRSNAPTLLITFMILVGFLGQLVLQGCAYPDETPRATIERLTGIDIAGRQFPHSTASSSVRISAAMMASMTGEMSAAPHSVMRAAATGPVGHHHHTHDGSCPLCPLLHLLAVTLTALPALFFALTIQRAAPFRPGAPRAPPQIPRSIPYSRGPPSTRVFSDVMVDLRNALRFSALLRV